MVPMALFYAAISWDSVVVIIVIIIISFWIQIICIIEEYFI